MEHPSHKHKRRHDENSKYKDEGHIKRKKHNHESKNEVCPPRSNGGASNSSNLAIEIDQYGSNTSKHTATQKLSKLLGALDDLLQDSDFEGVTQLLDDGSVAKLKQVRNSLRKQSQSLVNPRDPPHSKAQSQSRNINNISQSLSGSTIKPWRLSDIPSALPKLPAVLDRTLEAGAFIHHGVGSGDIHDLSYERLEWVGDAYLYMTSTLLISLTFPSLLPGRSSQLRERLVKNTTLAGYARQYGFEQRAVWPPELRGLTKHSAKDAEVTKVLGDIFEAYVAAVVLSDPEHGVIRVLQWLKDLWGMELRDQIKAEEARGLEFDSPLWRLRGDTQPVEIIPTGQRMLNAKEQLQKALGAKGVKIEYRDEAPAKNDKKDKNSKLPLFTIGVYLDGWGEKGKQLGFGTAGGKKDAGMKAAEMALANKKMMKVYIEKKRLFDAQIELEREALETQAGSEGT